MMEKNDHRRKHPVQNLRSSSVPIGAAPFMKGAVKIGPTNLPVALANRPTARKKLDAPVVIG